MKNYIRKIAVLLILSIFYLVLPAQQLQQHQISIPFACGFEDSTEITYWNINAGTDGPKCLDQWMIGNLEYNEGYNSMYISCDTGKTTNYGAKPNMVIAYRTIEIPSSLDPTKTTYSVDVSFDWKCLGEDRLSMLKFYFLPANFLTSESDLSSSATSASLPSRLSKVNPSATLYGSQDWQNWMSSNPTKVKVDTKYYLVFIWQNSNTDTAKFMPYGAVVDNIQVTSSNCWKPRDLEVTSACDTLWISWEGENEMYEFEYRPSGAKIWRGNTKLRQKNIVIPNIAEGSYDVRVRGICGPEQSAWLTKTNVISFCPDRHCINYVNLDRPGVTCEIGKASDPTKGRPALYTTGLGVTSAGPVDYGSNDKRSRHTVNWRQGEFDPRTDNKLRTIPEGSLASVRLGNWDINTQAEGVTFEYIVDTTQAFIILMKYAIVLEAPGHGPSADPYFKLEIIDQNGTVIDPNCGEFEFTPENKNIKWHKSGNYVWKDWTAIGLNLGIYHGQTIQIRLITQDCTYSAHSGYAYFTLDCADAAIKSTSCGETINMEMVAPDGFRYIWTRAENRDSVISTAQTISVPANDTTTYYCEVDYIDMEGCGFTLFTSVFPRFPHADFSWQWTPKDCSNNITIKNKSCVQTKIDGQLVPTSEKCETFHWIMNGGEDEAFTEDFVYTVPREGALLNITLISAISDGACQDDTTLTIMVPPIREHLDTIYETYCEGSVRNFDNQLIAIAGVYTEYKKNVWGCDSITVLNLNFVSQPDDVHIYDTICSNSSYSLNGKDFNEAGVYREILISKYGCDSVVFLHLEVEDPIGVTIEDEYRFACADDKEIIIPYDSILGHRMPLEYSVTFDSAAKQAGFVDKMNVEVDNNQCFYIDIPTNCRPNTYTATILAEDETLICDDFSVQVDFDIYYSASILEAKFGNLLTVYDAEHNGGYEFSSFQWYKNGEPMEGNTTSFFYLPEGEFFKAEDCYHLLVRRVDDGALMPTCEICPGVETDVDDILDENLLIQTVFSPGTQLVFDNIDNASVKIYSLTGQLLDSFTLDSINPQITLPHKYGFYILHIESSLYNKVYKIQVK